MSRWVSEMENRSVSGWVSEWKNRSVSRWVSGNIGWCVGG